MNITYADNGKRDIHSINDKYNATVERENKNKWISDNNKKIIFKYLRECQLGRVKSAGSNKKISKSTCLRLFHALKFTSEKGLKKDFDKATKEDWASFYERLETNELKGLSGNKYSGATKSKIYKTIRKFAKWRYGNNKYYPEFCDNWVTTEEKVTKEYLTRDQVEKLVFSSKNLRDKCLIMMLFDGGFRIEEFLNLRWKDLEKKPEGYYRVHIRLETSKTKTERYVSLRLATPFIETYKNAMKEKGKLTDEGFMFNRSYDSIRVMLYRLGKRVLNKRITPHMFRHSSATYFASIIRTYQQFCTRYGWTLRSEVPQTYYHAIADDEIAEQTKDHEISRFKQEFERVKLRNNRLEEEMMFIKRAMSHLISEKEKKKVKEIDYW